jgi:hypothetical protein
MRIGILAYGSLIHDTGDEIRELIVDRRSVYAPFCVEFAHKSKKRAGAPTLVPVDAGGYCCEVTLLILREDAALEYARDILYRREIGQVGRKDKHYIPDPSKENQVYVELLPDTFGLEYVLYTRIKADINHLTPDHLADLAIESAKKEAGKEHKDGISYLIDAKRYGIHTAMSDDYERKILEKTKASALGEAWQNVRV